jgi:hypothetical protein
MQRVEQFGRYLGHPVVGLDIAKPGRRSPVPADRPLTISLTLAEPLRHHRVMD